jgi:rhodanese-related sulfurtransferase
MKKVLASVLISFLGFFGSSTTVLAQDKPDTPSTLTGGKVVSVDDAKKMSEDGKTQFFDTRSALNFGKGHIKGAKLVAYREKSDFVPNFDDSQDKFELDKLPSDKATPIVIYSDGPKGWKSYKGAVLAVKAGYKNVMWLRDGTTGWVAKGMTLQ